MTDIPVSQSVFGFWGDYYEQTHVARKKNAHTSEEVSLEVSLLKVGNKS
jgi:hypothetical protein